MIRRDQVLDFCQAARQRVPRAAGGRTLYSREGKSPKNGQGKSRMVTRSEETESSAAVRRQCPNRNDTHESNVLHGEGSRRDTQRQRRSDQHPAGTRDPPRVPPGTAPASERGGHRRFELETRAWPPDPGAGRTADPNQAAVPAPQRSAEDEPAGPAPSPSRRHRRRAAAPAAEAERRRTRDRAETIEEALEYERAHVGTRTPDPGPGTEAAERRTEPGE